MTPRLTPSVYPFLALNPSFDNTVGRKFPRHTLRITHFHHVLLNFQAIYAYGNGRYCHGVGQAYIRKLICVAKLGSLADAITQGT